MAFHYSPKIVTDGLVLYLDAANTKSFVVGSSLWNDISRGGNNGILMNGATYSNINNGTMTFDGISQYIDCGNNTIINTAVNNCTINVWFKQTSSTSYYAALTNKGISDADENFMIGVNYNSSSLYFDVGVGSGPLIYTSYSYSLNTWYNICVTHNRSGGISTLKLYLNGIEIPSNTSNSSLTPITNNHSFKIGNGRSNTSPFPGKIPIVGLYNRELSASEVLQNFNVVKSRFGL